MNIILLSGGSGTRLWPLSNGIRSKQFIKLYKTGQTRESMIQRVYRQIRESGIADDGKIVITTSKSQISAIRNQLGNEVEVCEEPCRRDTFPAIALAASYMHDILGIDSREDVIVCPVDAYVEDDYFKAFFGLSELLKDGKTNLALLGINPTYPSSKYGYILPKNKDMAVSEVELFKEKPNEDTAEKYINEQGALWNCGVFAFRLSYALEKSEQLLGTKVYWDLLDGFNRLESKSFDYAVVEHETDIRVLRFKGIWDDMGTWNAIAETLDTPVLGNGKIDSHCNDVNIINELDIPIVALGISNTIICASPGGVLVTQKDSSEYLKDVLDGEAEDIRFADKSWGSFKVIDADDDSLTMKISIAAHDHMHYHSHDNRDEVWVVTSGTGKIIVNNDEQIIRPGDVVSMQAGVRHTVIAVSDLKMIEIQLGQDISNADKRRYDWDDRWSISIK